MLPNRPPASNSRRDPKGSSARSSEQRRRRGAMMALAVAVGTPANLMTALVARAAQPTAPVRPATAAPTGGDTYRAEAAPRPAYVGVVPALLAEQPKATDVDLLKQGQEQLAKRQYEEALATLQQVKADALPADQQAAYQSAIKDAESAANERKAARAEFEQGQAALDQKKPSEAAQHFQAAASNQFADEGTKRKASEQLALAQAQGGTAAAPAGEAPAAAAAPSGEEAGNPKAAYQLARKQYREGDWIAARKNFEIARDGGYKPGLFEDSPTKYLERMDKKESADRAKHDAELAAARAKESPVLAQDTSAPAAAAQPSGDAGAPPANPPANPPAGGGTAPAGSAQADLQAAMSRDQIAQQEKQYTARKRVEEARQAQAAGRIADAQRLYSEAAQLDPTNEQAQAGLRETEVLTGAARPEGNGNLPQSIQIRKQEIQYRFNQRLRDARTAAEQGRFPDARAALDDAVVARDSDAPLFTADEMRQMNKDLADVRADVDRRQAESERTSQQAAGEAQRRAEIQRREEEEQNKRRTIASLIERSQEAVRRRNYKQALGILDQVLTLDPQNDYARGARPLVYDNYQLQVQRNANEEREREMTNSFNAAEERKIPYEDILRYPENWPDISEMRDAEVKSERGLKQEDLAVQAQLDRRLPEINFTGQGLADVMDFLRDVSGSNIFVNWRALEAAGIAKDTPVTARLKDVRFSKALKTILDDVGGGNIKLTYTIDEGVITVSTADDLAKNTTTRVYDIRDLLVEVPDFDNAPDFSLLLSQSGGSGGTGGGGGMGGGGGGFGGGGGGGFGGGGGGGFGGGGGGGGGLFGGGGSGGTNQEKTQTLQERMDALVKLIQETVDPTSWRDAGGTVGGVKPLNGQLIVTQTPENQRNLVNLLEQLRETRAIQITIETRFLQVSKNFLEDVGLDLNATFNINSPGNGSKWSQIPLTQNSASFTQFPISGVPNSISNTISDQGIRALSLSGTYLDNFQVSFLLTATQASQTTTLLTAPRVTLFNGQRAYVLVANQRAYVSNLQAVVGNNSSSFQPQIGIVMSGVVLDVQATVSADRKYVTLTLRPQLAQLLNLFTFNFQAASAPTAATGNGTVVNNATSGFIQEPEIQLTEVRTTVSVPDGGTLLLGGQTLAGEVEKEMGVPVLSKIPFLKRLFTNRSMAKDENVLLILVKPTIIIQREQEQKQFPLLSSQVAGQ